jgi:predicted naringenin-chalcone synthase
MWPLVTHFPRIRAVATAHPPYRYSQSTLCDAVQRHTLGPEWSSRPETAETAQRIQRLFDASGVRERASAIDFDDFYRRPRSTAERMAEYQRCAYPLARAAVESCLNVARAPRAVGAERTTAESAAAISDLVVVTCTGYYAPGLDVELARDLALPRDARRVVVGHMGCFGALVGLRQALAAVRAYPGATALLASVELASLHFAPALDPEVLTSFALFGDAAAALVLANEAKGRGPAVVDTYCAAEFAAADQMRWTISDAGFVMGLSPRVPITLRRSVRGVVERLLTPHGLAIGDVTHWLVHPGGPSILEAIAGKLELSREQMALSWQVLADHGNCSSATVLLILERLLREERARPGEWGVMMAFGPGLTLETCLLRF